MGGEAFFPGVSRVSRSLRNHMSSAEETGLRRAWAALVALALALGVSTAVQWEMLPPAWLPRLPLLWGLAALLGAAAWRFSTPRRSPAGPARI